MGKFCEGVGLVTGQLCDVTSQCVTEYCSLIGTQCPLCCSSNSKLQSLTVLF